MPQMDPEALRALCLENDHLAVPLRPGVTVTWTDDETGKVMARGNLKRDLPPAAPARPELTVVR